MQEQRPENTYISVKGMVVLMLTFGAASVLRFFAAIDVPTDYAEATTLVAASRGFAIANFNSPITSMAAFLLGLPMRLFGSGSWVRVVTVLCGSGLVFPVYHLGRRFASETAGLIGAVFVAFAPLLYFHSIHVSTTVLAAFLLASSLTKFHDVLYWTPTADEDAPSYKRTVTLTAIAMVLLGTVTWLGVLALVPHLVMVLVNATKAPNLKHPLMILGGSLIAAGFTLYREWDSAVYALQGPFPWGEAIDRPVLAIADALFAGWRHGQSWSLVLAAGCLLFAIVGAVMAIRRGTENLVLVAWGLLVPAMAGVVLLSLGTPAPEDHLAMFLPGTLLLAGIGIAAIPTAPLKAVPVAGFLVMAFFGVRAEASGLTDLARQGTIPPHRVLKPYHEVAEGLLRRMEEGDLVAHTSPESAEVLNYEFNYRIGRRTHNQALDVEGRLAERYYRPLTANIETPERRHRLWGRVYQSEVVTHHFDRIWLVDSHWGTATAPWYEEHEAQLRTWLRQYYREGDNFEIAGVPITLYVVRDRLRPGTFSWASRPMELEGFASRESELP